ncbi:hypothetical protein [Flavobacterium sp.]|jgi:hypothetical protein|uniref:hypothetical protein n=1 Tax=Flavobacterium sp. TaxID=239 RepID=UPI002A8327C9|nr:hypothetical protein [Flavobacterium sp.]
MDFTRRIIIKDYLQLKQKGFLFVFFLISTSLFIIFSINLYNREKDEESIFFVIIISLIISISLITVAFLKVGFLVDKNRKLYKGLFFNERVLIIFKLKENTNIFSISEFKRTQYNSNYSQGNKDVNFEYSLYKFTLNGKKLILLDSKKDKDELKIFLELNTKLQQEKN